MHYLHTHDAAVNEIRIRIQAVHGAILVDGDQVSYCKRCDRQLVQEALVPVGLEAHLGELGVLADFHRLPRDRISGHLWPDADATTAQSQLASAVHVLRRALEPGVVAGTASRYLWQEGANLVLHLGQEDWVDYLALEGLLVAASAAFASGSSLIFSSDITLTIVLDVICWFTAATCPRICAVTTTSAP